MSTGKDTNFLGTIRAGPNSTKDTERAPADDLETDAKKLVFPSVFRIPSEGRRRDTLDRMTYHDFQGNNRQRDERALVGGLGTFPSFGGKLSREIFEGNWITRRQTLQNLR
ncbi:hypothetical protein QAD02_005109 [Eretmocerus hayati]|uniref:Uncharacterized protein n=1 Tax=Eretmocerus hayati TaxID=131215 RepID=A0ACC2NRY4_9HYME|nr:hypothetical protein QAD02_005109 [Eretmocerus hayati]